MKILTIDALDSLFNFIQQPKLTFWLRNKDYSKQVYLSQNVEDIWNIPNACIYQSPDIIIKSVERDKYANDIITLDNKRSNFIYEEGALKEFLSFHDEIYWRIRTPEGTLKYIYDRPFILLDKEQQHLGFGGIGGELTQEEWMSRVNTQECSQRAAMNEQLKNHIFDTLRRNAGVNFQSPGEYLQCAEKKSLQPSTHVSLKYQGLTISLTNREKEVLFHLIKGNSAKETGDSLYLSSRTVEHHLAKMKQKIGCRSKLELVSYAQFSE